MALLCGFEVIAARDGVFMRRAARLAASGTRRGLMLGRSAGTPTALRCSVLRPVAELTPLASQRYVQTGGDKSVHERAARGAASPALLVAPEIAPAGYRPPRVQRRLVYRLS